MAGAAAPGAVRRADSGMRRQARLADRWRYEAGIVLLGIAHVWRQTGDDRYGAYIKANMDEFVAADGAIRTYQQHEYNLDQINPGRLLFRLYETTREARYRRAAQRLREQILWQPRTDAGGFWHKLIYPFQMWLDGVYMAGPFMVEYAARFNEPELFDEAAQEILLMERVARDPQTGLLYHGWDERRRQRWADPQTGCSPHFWGRGLGWYVMALVDVLEHFPADHPQRAEIIAVLQRAAAAIVQVQDAESGVWFQILDQGGRAGNYLEASASCMFVYALARGIQAGYLDGAYRAAVRRAYAGILKQFIEVDAQGLVNVTHICQVAGLGGDPYRDGSFAYYVGEPVVVNDPKGVGAFILASGAVEALRGLTFSVGRGELYGLVGPDGAGKTTAIRTLAGVVFYSDF
jgi:unsaturated rhamnogalacturonyl hydrolase